MEAAMMNLGVVLPEPGYLEAVREITKQHDVVLIFDEVKTGLAIAAGGATERFGVQPDMVTLAKTLGGGLPSGAIGGTDEVMSIVEGGTVFQVGTFNGNPLTMAAARAGLLEVLTPEAYEHLDRINDRLVAGCQEVVDRYRLPGYTVGISSKGCVTFSDTKIVDYETFKANQNVEVTELAWLYNMNRGIFATPGREEEWTLSVTHTDEAADDYIAVFEELARDLTGSDQRHGLARRVADRARRAARRGLEGARCGSAGARACERGARRLAGVRSRRAAPHRSGSLAVSAGARRW